ncbi:MAG UNVERIFIED_CONTAM: hypothetical protein LVR18_36695 [Planctomycetaceae bacterium]|jgi:ribosomal protein L18E
MDPRALLKTLKQLSNLRDAEFAAGGPGAFAEIWREILWQLSARSRGRARVVE